MARIRILLALVVAVCAIAATAFAAGAAAHRRHHHHRKSPEANMMHKINHYRERHGVRRVKWSHSLKSSARHYAWRMMSEQYFGHARRIEASHKYRELGEILEWQRGEKPNVELAFQTWIHSSEHRHIILMSDFTYAGAGRAWGRFHGHKSTLWVMHFGRP